MPARSQRFLFPRPASGAAFLAAWGWLAIAFVASAAPAPISSTVPAAVAGNFTNSLRPLVAEYCLKCPSTEKHKGDLDLERFDSAAAVFQHPKPWLQVREQVAGGEMPPEDKPQPTAAQRQRLLTELDALLDAAAAVRAGDPGPVVLRRLNNAEYTYTIRDLTGVETLDPVREFPADSAAGEGFMNVGNALAMSPSLATKYLDAAKEIARHAVLLPDGIGFSPAVSARDWAEERLAAIRAFYGRFTENGGGTAVNLQGIKFDTKDGGVLPYEKYLAATLAERAALRSGATNTAAVARARGLNARYLDHLWTTLNGTNDSLLLDRVRAEWRAAGPGDAARVRRSIGEWQQALWRFTTVGHIGKRDGPAAWQVPVSPLAEEQKIRLKLSAPPAGGDGAVTLYLATTDAGDGDAEDFALWDNPRVVLADGQELPLRDVPGAVRALAERRRRLAAGTAACLAAAAEFADAAAPMDRRALAERHGVEPDLLDAWLDGLGLGAGPAPLANWITKKSEKSSEYDFIRGWVGDDALSVIANSSDQAVRVPGKMKPHGVAVHPSPKLRVVVGWRSPVAAVLRVTGQVEHAHPECGNGITWSLEVRRGAARRRLSAGVAQAAGGMDLGKWDRINVQPGDVVCVAVGPRDGNHSCDLTAVDLHLAAADGAEWDLAADVAPDILAGNPHADRQGHAGVWHFFSEPDNGGGPDPVLPAGSCLDQWLAAAAPADRERLALAVQQLLTEGAGGAAVSGADAALRRQLTGLDGPLWRRWARGNWLAAARAAAPGGDWGLPAARFGLSPGAPGVPATSVRVHAPEVLAVRLPADLAAGAEFAATVRVDPAAGPLAGIQASAALTPPARLGLAAGAARETGGKSTWSDGERPVVSDAPVLARQGGAAWQRWETAADAFRQLFPAALCYTKIVPVDEVVTLTLYYREDDAMRRLLLTPAEAAELDRLWSELHFVSQDPLKLVDGFEQLWQFATQDADPSAFEPLRAPIQQKAAEFRQWLTNTQPAHLTAALEFAARAYRRPLTTAEGEELRALYAKLRAQELPHDPAVRLLLARALVAPAFLYRAEAVPEGEPAAPVNDWELATRLSYFLWSSAPDAELTAAAAAGRLHQPAELTAQTQRLLRDPRVRRLATEFACTWLHIHDFDTLDEKSERHFPAFAGARGALYEEAIRYFTDLFQNDGSVLEIFDADHTFLNGPLAEYYGIPGVKGAEWRRVADVRQFGRGGILGLGATLAKQSGASRTSPILRGNWVSEVLLGERLPRPPKDVPRLPEDEAADTLTVRELVARHSADPKCSGCHRRIDGFGFALEGFDAVGRRREKDLGGRPVETQATFFDGTTVAGAAGLRDYLVHRRRETVVDQFDRKLLGYALGRAVQLSDRPLLSEIRRGLEGGGYHFHTAVSAIVTSRQFREIRGRESAADE